MSTRGVGSTSDYSCRGAVREADDLGPTPWEESEEHDDRVVAINAGWHEIARSSLLVPIIKASSSILGVVRDPERAKTKSHMIAW